VVGDSARAAAQLIAGGEQQAAGIEQIALALQHIDRAAQQSLAGTRQTEGSARALNELAAQHRTMREHMASMPAPGCGATCRAVP
jgi:methyl-accepting chemotaxis protein